jgi:hypothetical protein
MQESVVEFIIKLLAEHGSIREGTPDSTKDYPTKYTKRQRCPFPTRLVFSLH